MKKLLPILMLCLILSLAYLALSSSVNPHLVGLQKKIYLYRLNNFIEKIETESRTFEEDKWQQATVDYYHFSQSKYTKFKPYFTPSERLYVNQQFGKYRSFELRYYQKRLKNDFQDVVDRGKSFMKEFIDP